MNENTENTGDNNQDNKNEEIERSFNLGKVPISALNALNEHCVGGFILYYLNAETGEPDYAMTFDNFSTQLALQYYAKNFADTMDKINKHNVKASLLNDFTDGEENIDIDDDEEL
jgi:hypothetical protein